MEEAKNSDSDASIARSWSILIQKLPCSLSTMLTVVCDRPAGKRIFLTQKSLSEFWVKKILFPGGRTHTTNMIWDENAAPQEEPVSSVAIDQLPHADVTSKIKSLFQVAVNLVVIGYFAVMLAVGRGEDQGRRAVETDMIQVDQSAAQDLQLEQSAAASNSKAVLQVTVALVFAGGSFAAMYAVPGGLNEAGRAVMGNTVAFLGSLAVAMIVATVSHISPKMEYFIRITLRGTAVCFILSFHASGYVVVIPTHKWIVLCFGGVVTIAFSLLLLYRLSIMFLERSGMAL
ncbi:hypothetical protein SUGI_0548640 [Cryptomeria japonica]|nr:hypothetical protein SUGI_0548640 [Cryptomeria japonica]